LAPKVPVFAGGSSGTFTPGKGVIQFASLAPIFNGTSGGGSSPTGTLTLNANGTHSSTGTIANSVSISWDSGGKYFDVTFSNTLTDAPVVLYGAASGFYDLSYNLLYGDIVTGTYTLLSGVAYRFAMSFMGGNPAGGFGNPSGPSGTDGGDCTLLGAGAGGRLTFSTAALISTCNGTIDTGCIAAATGGFGVDADPDDGCYGGGSGAPTVTTGNFSITGPGYAGDSSVTIETP
jgi:hypothetical protein